MEKTNLSTKNLQVILASSSQTRGKQIKKIFKTAIVTNHLVNEEKVKNENNELSPDKLVVLIAKLKAESLMHKYEEELIIGSDQLLVFRRKIISKPKSLKEAQKNLLRISGKEHTLLSSVYVIKRKRHYFNEVKKARIFFKLLTEDEIEEYVEKNKKTVLSTVGSYKIEENQKYNFVKILSGDMETILGFPVKSLIEKINQEKK
tara:strand:- start:43 stop:654 length:612 start_codon:yes stop_codon:yes gene_type:complete